MGFSETLKQENQDLWSAILAHPYVKELGSATLPKEKFTFYVKQDYYNGINVAFLYTLKALQTEDDFDAIVFYGHGNLIRERVADVCLKMMEAENFAGRGDKEWVVQTLAQAYLGMGKEARAEALMPKIGQP